MIPVRIKEALKAGRSIQLRPGTILYISREYERQGEKYLQLSYAGGSIVLTCVRPAQVEVLQPS